MAAKVWIVLVDYNGVEDTQNCLRSLYGQSYPTDVVVVDNASQVDVKEALSGEFPGVHFLRAPNNGGWAGGNNLGIKYAIERGARWIILLNNDTTVGRDFTERLMLAAEAHPEFGILGPIIRFMSPPHEVQTDGVEFNRPHRKGFFQRHPVPLKAQTPPGVVPVDIVNGCCLAVRRDVVETIGLIDEHFFLIHEESDFCLRAQAAGFQNGVLTESLVWHKGSSSFQREGKGLQRYFDARNLLRLIAKHGSRPGSRGKLRSYMHHLRYSFHRYAVEREKGYRDSAEAVIHGLYDGFIGFWGPKQSRRRPGAKLISWLFSFCWKYLASKPAIDSKEHPKLDLSELTLPTDTVTPPPSAAKLKEMAKY